MYERNKRKNALEKLCWQRSNDVYENYPRLGKNRSFRNSNVSPPYLPLISQPECKSNALGLGILHWCTGETPVKCFNRCTLRLLASATSAAASSTLTALCRCIHLGPVVLPRGLCSITVPGEETSSKSTRLCRCVLLGPLVLSVVLCGLSSITVPSDETSLQMSEPRAQQDCTRAR